MDKGQGYVSIFTQDMSLTVASRRGENCSSVSLQFRISLISLMLYRSSVIGHLARVFGGARASVLYYYCDYKDPKSQSTQKVFDTLLAQVARSNTQALEDLDRFSKRYREFRSSCTPEVLCKTLVATCQYSTRTFLVIDALDECFDRGILIEQLLEIAKSNGKISLFVTSREELDIVKQLSTVPQITLVPGNMRNDIDLYIHHQLDDRLRTGTLKVRDTRLRKEIESALSNKADGM
jgi:hypothetical protein